MSPSRLFNLGFIGIVCHNSSFSSENSKYERKLYFMSWVTTRDISIPSKELSVVYFISYKYTVDILN